MCVCVSLLQQGDSNGTQLALLVQISLNAQTTSLTLMCFRCRRKVITLMWLSFSLSLISNLVMVHSFGFISCVYFVFPSVHPHVTVAQAVSSSTGGHVVGLSGSSLLKRYESDAFSCLWHLAYRIKAASTSDGWWNPSGNNTRVRYKQIKVAGREEQTISR